MTGRLRAEGRWLGGRSPAALLLLGLPELLEGLGPRDGRPGCQRPNQGPFGHRADQTQRAADDTGNPTGLAACTDTPLIFLLRLVPPLCQSNGRGPEHYEAPKAGKRKGKGGRCICAHLGLPVLLVLMLVVVAGLSFQML